MIPKKTSSIEFLISPQKKDLGGFSVRRILPAVKKRMVGPWIFFDHMGPAEFDSHTKLAVRPHPHINLATVTYLFEGEIIHRDSLGSHRAIRPGDINLMVAGKGIVHSERETPERMAQVRKMDGLQLWFALPTEAEEISPAFYHYPSSEIPTALVDGVPVRVMMGQAYGVISPVKSFSETLYLEARLSAGQSLDLPLAEERALYVAAGSVTIAGERIERFHMATLRPGEKIKVQATEDALIVLVGGTPIGERHLFWNFASSRKERLEKAKQDWLQGRFPKIPGDDDEFIPLPEG